MRGSKPAGFSGAGERAARSLDWVSRRRGPRRAQQVLGPMGKLWPTPIFADDLTTSAETKVESFGSLILKSRYKEGVTASESNM